MAASALSSVGWNPRLCTPAAQCLQHQTNQGRRTPLCHIQRHFKLPSAHCQTGQFLSGRPVVQKGLQQAGPPTLRKRAIEAKSSNRLLDTVIGTGKTGLKVATDLVPSSVPRPIAGTGVVVVGGLLLLSLLKSIVSTAVTLVVVGGLAYAAFIYAKNNDNSGGSGGGDSSENDSLAEAKRIMDKYK